LQKIAPRSLPLEVSSRFLTQIVDGEYPPGSTLPPENELAQSFDVSRIVVREAMRILGTKGVVSVRQGRNTTVNLLSEWNHLDPQILLVLFESRQLGELAHHLVEIRRILEVEAAGLAAERARDEEIQHLGDLVDEMQSYELAVPAYFTLENEFHAYVWKMSRNALLEEMLAMLQKVFEMVKEHSAIVNGADRDQWHVALCDAMEKRDTSAARSAMEADVTQFERQVARFLANGPVEPVQMGLR
jgi:GntR family transcriptional regulator, transcriptional repressor for pyruvate dehydrogenase complex